MSDFLGFLGAMFIVWGVTCVFVEPPILPTTVAYAEEKCSNNNGWKMIEEGYNNMATVYCNDGAEFNYDPSEIHKEKNQ